ncbi:hypothetical protein [Reyranella sp. CPCC 100927]|uniref:hypothetical protein n=1 Tax=Reyranella sp. CPCC 100927 TaxID=2599616 RepID=UPI0011B3A748|nr:hypothetical protein [Reyranella sp. CPCC 100927]TWT10687.1 hypothetical protein FQU96_16360 [Reyranella sp. CPCC 100927]
MKSHAATGGRRVAIVSTYDELCGIAGYTRALEAQLSASADVTVFDLDQYLLRTAHPRVRKLGDKHIEEIARQLSTFDCVNIQFEYGTLGRTRSEIVRRFVRLAEAAPSLTITFHTVHPVDPLPWPEIRRALLRGQIGKAIDSASSTRQISSLGNAIYGTLRRLQRTKWVSAIVHTYRDMQLMRDVQELTHVFHHPLSFVSAEKARNIRQSVTRADFPTLAALPPDAKLIGTFGFLSSYKGFEVAIRALRLLPEDYHLLVFGGVHPQNIKKHQEIDPYVASLLKEGGIGQPTAGAPDVASRRNDLTDRIHFLGVLSDDAFTSAMAVCDTVVLPYLEVGQSSSGPVSIALEMGCRVLASRTTAFRQLARYHPDRIKFFDIGNFAELAGLIRSAPPAPVALSNSSFNPETNLRLYLDAMRLRPLSQEGGRVFTRQTEAA